MKIVSLSPSATETLVMLGLEDEIVGVTPWCKMYLDNPNKEVVGTYLNISFDKLEKINPDIVFLQSRVHDKIFEVVRSKGFNAYLVPLPTNIYSIIAHIVVDVGSIVDRYYEARELGEKLLYRVLKMLERSRDLKRVRVYIEYLWPDKTYSTTGSLTYIDDGVRIAGGENIFRDMPKEFFYPIDRDIVERNPDVVLVNIEPPWTGLTIERYKSIRESLSSTKAFKENRILLVEESRYINLAHFGPSFIDTVEWLQKQLNRISIDLQKGSL